MKKLIIISILLTSTLFGYNYNELLIKAQSSIFPKILLLDKKLDDKLVNGKIVYVIAHEKSDIHAAKNVQSLIDKKFKGRLGKYELEIKLLKFSDISADTKATAIYALNSSHGIEKISKLTSISGYMTFAYDINNLNHGLLLSLMIEKSTIIYLSKQGLQNHDVDFVDSLYQIVRFANR